MIIEIDGKEYEATNEVADLIIMISEERDKLKKIHGYSAADVRVFLAESLPCYGREIGDEDFLFIASADDIEKCAFALWRKFQRRRA